MDLRIEADEVTIATTYNRMVGLDITGADRDEILAQMDLQDVIDHYPLTDILDLLDIDEIRDYFGLEDCKSEQED